MPPTRAAVREAAYGFLATLREQIDELTEEGDLYEDERVRMESARKLVRDLRLAAASAKALPRLPEEEIDWTYRMYLSWVRTLRAQMKALPSLSRSNVEKLVKRSTHADSLANLMEISWTTKECLKLIDTAPSDWLINAIAAREHVHPQTVKDRVHRREKRVRVRKKKHTG